MSDNEFPKAMYRTGTALDIGGGRTADYLTVADGGAQKAAEAEGWHTTVAALHEAEAKEPDAVKRGPGRPPAAKG